ncbi:MAG: hypothetical protein A3F16_07085 [Deltaproteobacteria bacterium RIFCSPHIGHO2_12_FULL_43_9]|nr:MAG: hypothetical protein A3F16_07085 [Deltaproteobacteria bacterium RIFCSPHIGHO2_12_FULL_43_9]
MKNKIFAFFILFTLGPTSTSLAEKMLVNVEEDSIQNSAENNLDPLYDIDAAKMKRVKRAFWDQETKVVGIGLGFGLGHLMAGEYKNRGWIYTAAEMAALVAFGYGVSSYFGDTSISSFGKAVGSFMTLNEAVPSQPQPTSNIASLTMVAGFVGFLAVKLVEGFEVWNKPKVVVLKQ